MKDGPADRPAGGNALPLRIAEFKPAFATVLGSQPAGDVDLNGSKVEERPRTVIAVNVGGAVVPTLLSLYLLVNTGLYSRALAGVAIVTAVVHALAYSVKGRASLQYCSREVNRKEIRI